MNPQKSLISVSLDKKHKCITYVHRYIPRNRLSSSFLALLLRSPRSLATDDHTFFRLETLSIPPCQILKLLCFFRRPWKAKKRHSKTSETERYNKEPYTAMTNGASSSSDLLPSNLHEKRDKKKKKTYKTKQTRTDAKLEHSALDLNQKSRSSSNLRDQSWLILTKEWATKPRLTPSRSLADL
jgi:hypothetical protein